MFSHTFENFYHTFGIFGSLLTTIFTRVLFGCLFVLRGNRFLHTFRNNGLLAWVYLHFWQFFTISWPAWWIVYHLFPGFPSAFIGNFSPPKGYKFFSEHCLPPNLPSFYGRQSHLFAFWIIIYHFFHAPTGFYLGIFYYFVTTSASQLTLQLFPGFIEFLGICLPQALA